MIHSGLPPFQPFRKIPRYRRDITISEKLDGSNAVLHVGEDGQVVAGSRSRWLSPGKQTDNHGFAAWVAEHENELRALGPGYHYGEWWGQSINRGYDLTEKRFSLFNAQRWAEERPACCGVVPVLYEGLRDEIAIAEVLWILDEEGSYAAPGFMRPEGIVIFDHAAKTFHKITLENDAAPRGRPGV